MSLLAGRFKVNWVAYLKLSLQKILKIFLSQFIYWVRLLLIKLKFISLTFKEVSLQFLIQQERVLKQKTLQNGDDLNDSSAKSSIINK